MLKNRLQGGLILGGAFLACIFLLPLFHTVGELGALVILLCVCGLAMLEFYSLLDAAGIVHFKVLGTLGGLFLILATWLELAGLVPQLSGEVNRLFIFIIAASIFVRQFFEHRNANPLHAVAGTLMGILYVALLFNYITLLLMAGGSLDGRWLLLYLICVVKFTDMGAYFVGSALGRHKLMPTVSPKKTWEGFIGGIGAGVLASLLFWGIVKGDFVVVQMGWVDALVLGVILSGVGTFGDLFESLLKRAANVKDASNLIQGLGGALDVLDSILMTAPLLYYYAHFFLRYGNP